ncbi:MAG: hypothetical protein IKE89_03500 [Bacilli bacterium]|nr:hypothetical protein [Bacilli bacterium]MBR2711517.1 hypothetical protein [Bacilli bacterium]
MKLIYQTKRIWVNGELQLENITNYIRKYFDDNNLIVVKDYNSGSAFYHHFKIGYKKYDSKIEEINKKYQIDDDDEYWYFKVKE